MVYVFVETLKRWKNLTTKFKFFHGILRKKKEMAISLDCRKGQIGAIFFNFVPRCILLIFYPFSGANASSKLNLFEQTVKWCSGGLKVSFCSLPLRLKVVYLWDLWYCLIDHCRSQWMCFVTVEFSVVTSPALRTRNPGLQLWPIPGSYFSVVPMPIACKVLLTKHKGR